MSESIEVSQYYTQAHAGVYKCVYLFICPRFIVTLKYHIHYTDSCFFFHIWGREMKAVSRCSQRLINIVFEHHEEMWQIGGKLN
jgi:hypothetical protein